MSDEEELRKLREQRLAQLQQNQMQAQQNAQMAAQQQAINAQKNALIQKILSSDARARLSNIRLARPQFAEAIEMQLINKFQTGALRGRLPLSDPFFKEILIQIQNHSQSREQKIKFR
ncbi:MAG: DNA-binding protein [Promethearchaeota archaeon]